MTDFRRFSNRDTPALVAIWNRQPAMRGRLRRLTNDLFEQYVLAKPYFDPRGLIVAADGEKILGFVHAGCPPGETVGEMLCASGTIAQLVVDPSCTEQGRIAQLLLERAEVHLRERGPAEWLGGGVGWSAPFYLGLYGGSSLPGVLAGDEVFLSALQHAGYSAHRQHLVMLRNLADFRPPVDRQLIQLRRQYRLDCIPDTGVLKWNEACAWSWTERDLFVVVPLADGAPRASLAFWNIEPLSQSWGSRTAGLLAGSLASSAPAELLPCFLGEAMRRLQAQGVSAVEVQVEANTALLSQLQRLGFQEVDRGVQFRKEVCVPA